MRMRAALALLFVVVCAPALFAQVTIDTPTRGTCTGAGGAAPCTSGTTLTFAHTANANSNRALAVSITIGCDTADTPPTVSTVTYNSVGLSSVESAAGTGSRVYLYALAAGTQPATGANNVVVTLASNISTCTVAGANARVNAIAFSAYNVNQTTTFTDTNIATGNSTTPALTLTGSGAYDAGFHAACAGQDVISTTETIQVNYDDNTTFCSASGAATAAAGDVNFSWTITSDFWCMTGGAFKYVGGTVVLSNTITATTTEADLVAGGKVAVLTLTNDAWADNFASISYVGGQDNSFAGTVSNTDVTFTLTGGLAATPAAGDLVVVTFCTGSTVDRTLAIANTAGTAYTLIGSELYANDLFDVNMRVAYRFMPGTPETAVRFVGGSINAADAGVYAIQVFRNVDTGTPLDVAAQTATNINTRLINPPSITPTTAGAFIGVSGCGAGATLTADYTSPGGAAVTDFRTDGQTDTNDAGVAAWHNTTWTSGAYDAAALTGGGVDTVDDSWGSVVWALRPATDNAFDDQRDELRDGCDSAQAEGAGWDARKATILPVGNVVRTSSTVVTMTAAADGSFNITAQETVTCTVPGAILAGTSAIVATPTFTIDATGGGGTAVKDVIGGAGGGIIAFPR